MVLVLESGPDAAASHRSAAALLGVPGFSRSGHPEVTTPRPRRHRTTGGVVHRWRPFPDHHLTVVEGIATTRPARTLVDLAGVLHPARTERAVDNCLSAGILTLADLHSTFIELAGRGRKGIALMRRLLDERGPGYVAPASELEARFLALVRDAGLPEPERQLDVGDHQRWAGRVDVAYPVHGLVIELDSRRYHDAKVDLEDDQVRDQGLMAGGWRVIRIRWKQLTERPDEVVSLLQRLLRHAA